MSEHEFRSARTSDERDAEAFRRAFANHVKEGQALRGPETIGYVNDYLKRTLALMERAAAIGGDRDNEMRILESAADACKQLLNSHTGAEGAAVLERAMALHHLQIYNPFLAQSFRSDSPFPKSDTEGWLRALLSEEDTVIENTATFIGGLEWNLIDTARAILTSAVEEGLPSVDAKRKLGCFERGYSKGTAMVPQPEG